MLQDAWCTIVRGAVKLDENEFRRGSEVYDAELSGVEYLIQGIFLILGAGLKLRVHSKYVRLLHHDPG